MVAIVMRPWPLGAQHGRRAAIVSTRGGDVGSRSARSIGTRSLARRSL
jgi:hypothetical protein